MRTTATLFLAAVAAALTAAPAAAERPRDQDRAFEAIRDRFIGHDAARIFARHEIKTDFVTRPTFPKAVTGIGNHGNERNASREIQLLQHTREDVLREWMNAYDDVRTPAFKQIRNVRHTAFMKELTRLRSDVVHAPVEILHPVLPVAQYPVV